MKEVFPPIGFQKELSDVRKSCLSVPVDIFILTENRAFSILQETAPARGHSKKPCWGKQRALDLCLLDWLRKPPLSTAKAPYPKRNPLFLP